MLDSRCGPRPPRETHAKRVPRKPLQGSTRSKDLGVKKLARCQSSLTGGRRTSYFKLFFNTTLSLESKKYAGRFSAIPHTTCFTVKSKQGSMKTQLTFSRNHSIMIISHFRLNEQISSPRLDARSASSLLSVHTNTDRWTCLRPFCCCRSCRSSAH